MAADRKEWAFKSGTCLKVTLLKGKLGERPKDCANCEVFTCLEDGAHIQCVNSKYFKSEFSGTLIIGNYDSEIDGQIDKCLQTMVPGEECLLSLRFQEFPSVVVVKITLKGFIQSADIYRWSREEKLKTAKDHKQTGVQLFQAGQFSDSFLRLKKSIKLLVTLGLENDQEATTLYVQVCNNMAWCHLKLGSSIHALTLCNKVLAIEPTNVKALLRRSVVYTKLNDIESAVIDLRQVKKLEPNNGVARERLVLLQHKLDLENIKYANVIKRMFQ